MTGELTYINNFIARIKPTVNGRYRQGYHLTPPAGWMNDPNGLVYFGGKYHLYYQFNPYDTKAGRMIWGHCVSDDLITFTDCGAALVPEEEGASAFSGGAIECGGRICALYTLHRDDPQSEEVYTAYSSDGYAFGRGVKAFDNENLPENISRKDFRDPCPVKIGDEYFVFVGGKDEKLNKGVIVVLGGKTPEKLEYKFCLGPFYELGDMGECPCYMKIDGKDVIITSGCRVAERGNDFKNINSSVFIVGDLDFKKGGMKIDFIKEIDKGDAFYAPQFVRGAKTPVMIGWQEMWNKPYPTKSHGWVGAFTIPREISVRDGDIFQSPVKSFDKYLIEVRGGKIPVCADISFSFDGAGELTVEAENGKITVGCDKGVYLDTRLSNNSVGTVRRTDGEYKRCAVRLLLDVSGAEVFADGGREVISSRIYLDGEYKLKTEGGVKNITVKEWRKQ